MVTGLIFDIKKFSIHDGPGIRTTVFFKGCPLSCWWCHNPEGQSLGREIMFRERRCIRCGACQAVCTQGAISMDGDVVSTDREKCTLCGACVEACYAEARELVGREVTVAEVMAEIEQDVAFYDESGGGVTFSGGEPLLQRNFLLALLRACREKEIHTAVDTCGFATWETLDSLREHVDLFLYDLKSMDDARHLKSTGVSNELILGNLHRLSTLGHDIILRVPVIPGINDDDENIRQTGAFAATLSYLNRLDVLPYHRAGTEKYHRLNKVYELPEARPPSDERMAKIVRILRGFGLQIKIGG
ncbi:MAG: glycyl-radical enzyme activating protein [Anaerolineales bacterium]|nr:glycyl-radical enzyme activating protein [Anaerolineales bacterium]